MFFFKFFVTLFGNIINEFSVSFSVATLYRVIDKVYISLIFELNAYYFKKTT